MANDVISLVDYSTAIEAVLDRVNRACANGPIADAGGEARLILRRVEATRRQLHITTVEQCEFERVAGRPLPAGIKTWLTECSRRLFAQDFVRLAADILSLCRALEATLRLHLA